MPYIDPSVAPSLAEHKEWAIGLNYWFNYNFVIKLSYHKVDGNIFAVPETVTEIVQDGFEEETHLFVLGTQFSF